MSDPDLGPLFRSSGAPTGGLDADAIIARSRRRRLPRLVVVTVVPILAVVGVLSGGVYGLAQMGGVSSSGVASGASVNAEAPAHGVVPSAQAAPMQRGSVTQVCGSPISGAATAAHGLVASSRFPNPDSAASPAQTTITNTGPRTISGTAGTPSVVFERDGLVVAQSEISDSVGRVIELAPGASLTLEVDQPAPCSGTSLSGKFTVVTFVSVTLRDGAQDVVSGPATQVDFDK